ncbi:cytochrome P450 [Rhizophagus clarus]|uniref:Cytochrome P450 n=1 Tax=Rhizophagus clarus TaxID=94130 RepID=A0A8H3KXS3_9GLOM|nr:cytochrome P450 [Rhizophagus clarus]
MTMVLKLFEISDFLLLLSAIITIYVAQYYYKYFTRVNPLPGPFPFPFIGNLPQYNLWFKGDIKAFYGYNYKKYGDIYEVHLNGNRNIVLARVEYIEKLLTPSIKNSHLARYPNDEGLNELGIGGKGILFNQDHKSWKYNRQFFTQAILSPKFNNEAIYWTNRLFDELEGYWNKLYLKEEIIKENKNIDFTTWFSQYTNDMIIKLLTGERSYSMAAYFDTLSDEKSEHPRAIVDDSVRLVQALRKLLVGFILFVYVPPFLRHYIPYFKNKADDLLQSVRFINKRLDEIIKNRRKEIENTPLDKSLPNDMLTSVITANTPRDVNYTKTVGGEALNRPLTDSEIRGNILDGFLAGTDTTANTISYIKLI